MDSLLENPALPTAIGTVLVAFLAVLTGGFKYATGRRKEISAENLARQEQIMAANESALAAWKDFLDPLRERVVELEEQRQRDRDRIVELEAQGKRQKVRIAELIEQHEADREARIAEHEADRQEWESRLRAVEKAHERDKLDWERRLHALAKENVTQLQGIALLIKQLVDAKLVPDYRPRRLEDKDTQ